MKIKRLFALIIVLGIVLAVAAFGSGGINNALASVINTVKADGPANSGSLVVSSQADTSGSLSSSAVQIVPAAELPARAPDTTGFFNKLEGSTLTLQYSIVVTGDMQDGGVVSGVGIIAAAGNGAPQSGVINLSEPVQSGTSSDLADLQTLIVTGEMDQSGAVSSIVVSSGIVSTVPGSASAISTADLDLPAAVIPDKIVVTEATKLYHDITEMNIPQGGSSQVIQQVLEAGSLDELTGQMMVTVWGHMDGEQFTADVIVYCNPMMPQ